MKARLSEAGLSLGSNLGERRAQLTRALRRLDAECFAELNVSALWEGEAVEVAEAQPSYLNLCAVGLTELSPEALLGRCQELEREAGREPGGHRRSRTLDLDLLYYDRHVLRSDSLCLPHPGLIRRRFVLAPLAELRPDWCHPLNGKSVSGMLAELNGAQPLRRLDGGRDWWRHD